MSIAHYERLPQGTTPNRPYFLDKKLLVNRFLLSDPLTGRAYFDTTDLSIQYEALKRHKQRAFNNPEQNFMQVNIHADLLDFESLHQIGSVAPTNGGGGVRGEVRGFSRASRKRMIEFMAKARFVGQLLFATFTYPDEFPIDDKKAWNAHFEALRRRIERQYPHYRIVWRKELKRRKSGKNFGMVAPHYHMIIDTLNDAPAQIEVETHISYGKSYPKTVSSLSRSFETWALQAWSEIVASGDGKHAEMGCFVVACRNRRHAYSYISKYVAKAENDDYSVGRRWGRIGRWDTSKSDEVVLTKKELIELKRLIRKWMKSRGIDYRRFIAKMPIENGFTVLGLGDLARTKSLYQLMLNHVADLCGEIRPFGDWVELSSV